MTSYLRGRRGANSLCTDRLSKKSFVLNMALETTTSATSRPKKLAGVKAKLISSTCAASLRYENRTEITVLWCVNRSAIWQGYRAGAKHEHSLNVRRGIVCISNQYMVKYGLNETMNCKIVSWTFHMEKLCIMFVFYESNNLAKWKRMINKEVIKT